MKQEKTIWEIFKIFTTWLVSTVVLPILAALTLSFTVGWDFNLVISGIVLFFVGCFFLAIFYKHTHDFIKGLIRDLVYEVLVDLEIIEEKKK